MASGCPTEFTLESVRQFMLARDGRVTNHDLVKHFKAWLTHPDPAAKNDARAKFKEFVNVLATIKSEHGGEKFLVLKPQFYPKFDDDEDDLASTASAGTSLLDEVMAGFRTSQFQPPQVQQRQPPPQPQRRVLPQVPQQQNYQHHVVGLPQQPQPPHQPHRSFSNLPPPVPPPYRPPPVSSYQRSPPPPVPDYGLPVYGRQMSAPAPSQQHSGLPPPPTGFGAAYGSPDQPPPLPRRNNEFPSNSSSARSSMSSLHGLPYQPQPSRPMLYAPPPHQPHRPQPQVPGLPRTNSSPQVPPPLPSRNVMPQQQLQPQSQQRISASALPPAQPAAPPLKPATPPRTEDDKENRSSSERFSTPPEEFEEEEEKPKDEKISVKERTKTFNRMASEVDMRQVQAALQIHGEVSEAKSTSSSKPPSRKTSSSVKRRNSRAASSSTATTDKGSDDSGSIGSGGGLDVNGRTWMVKAAQGDYHAMTRMLRDDPRLARLRDFTSGFTAVHWAAKHGSLDAVKLLAGAYKADVNVKSHGGYTPLHLACQFGHQDVFDLLVKAYGADPHVRDNHGKTPRQYMMAQAAQDPAMMQLSLSSDTFRQLKDRRKSRRMRQENGAGQNSGSILRFGSLSVKVKKTTEAFNNYFGERKSSWGSNSDERKLSMISNASSATSRKSSWASSIAEEIDEASSKMPPPKSMLKKRKSSRKASTASDKVYKSAPTTPTSSSKDIAGLFSNPMQRSDKSDESDSEFGFDSQWAMPSLTR